MDRPAKLRRLNAFRRAMPHASASALAAILKVAETGELPELHSRRDLRHATAAIMDADTPFGTLAQPTEEGARSAIQTLELLGIPRIS